MTWCSAGKPLSEPMMAQFTEACILDLDELMVSLSHDDVIKGKHFPRNWLFVRGIHRSPVNSPHKGQWRGALMFSLICVWMNDWVNNREAGNLRRYRAHYDVIVMAKNLLGKWGFAAPMTCNTYGVICALTSIGSQKYCLTNLTG